MNKAERILQLAQENADAYGIFDRVPTGRAIMAWMERQNQIRVQICEFKEKREPTGASTA